MTVNDFVALVKCAHDFNFNEWATAERCVHATATFSPEYPDVGLLHTHACTLALVLTFLQHWLPDPWHISICWHWIAGYIYSNTFIFYWIGASRHRKLLRAIVPAETSNDKQIARVKRVTKPNTKRIKASYVSIYAKQQSDKVFGAHKYALDSLFEYLIWSSLDAEWWWWWFFSSFGLNKV